MHCSFSRDTHLNDAIIKQQQLCLNSSHLIKHERYGGDLLCVIWTMLSWSMFTVPVMITIMEITAPRAANTASTANTASAHAKLECSPYPQTLMPVPLSA
jgi:hypothetical protein